MTKIVLVVCAAGMAFADDTVRPGRRPGNTGCVTSSFDARITEIDRENGEVTFVSAKSGTRKLKIGSAVIVRSPAASKADAKQPPISLLQTDTEAKVTHCRQNDQVVEIKLKK